MLHLGWTAASVGRLASEHSILLLEARLHGHAVWHQSSLGGLIPDIKDAFIKTGMALFYLGYNSQYLDIVPADVTLLRQPCLASLHLAKSLRISHLAARKHIYSKNNERPVV